MSIFTYLPWLDDQFLLTCYSNFKTNSIFRTKIWAIIEINLNMLTIDVIVPKPDKVVFRFKKEVGNSKCLD